ncbi:MAG: 23S rRNA (pseudouridine(1915)-N(3))-methyltransferase, partial [uncultured Solirubrobacteraceae bacterium]
DRPRGRADADAVRRRLRALPEDARPPRAGGGHRAARGRGRRAADPGAGPRHPARPGRAPARLRGVRGMDRAAPPRRAGPVLRGRRPVRHRAVALRHPPVAGTDDPAASDGPGGPPRADLPGPQDHRRRAVSPL